jgi:phage shock protein C
MKRLYRSSRERMIAGVAGGLAEYFDIDPVFVRAIFVASIFLSGIGILIYLVLWIITPQTPLVPASSSENASAFGAATAAQTLSPEELETQKKAKFYSHRHWAYCARYHHFFRATPTIV